MTKIQRILLALMLLVAYPAMQTPQHATRRYLVRSRNRRNRSTVRRKKRAIPMSCT